MNSKFLSLSQKIDSNVIMRAIRHALIITVPILMIGSLALMLKSLPVAVYHDFIVNFGGGILYDIFSLMYDACFGFFAIFLVINVSISYLMEYTSSLEDYMTVPATALAGFLILVNAGTERFDISNLSVNGTFAALFSSLVISVLIRRLQNVGREWNVPPWRGTAT